MTREPLMLSDTAMLILQRYIEVSEYEEEQKFDEIEPFAVMNEKWNLSLRQQHLDAIYMLKRSLRRELVTELWVLWNHPDISPRRSLEWHLVLDEEAMQIAERLFCLPPQNSWTELKMDAHFFWREHFVTIFACAYAYKKRNDPR